MPTPRPTFNGLCGLCLETHQGHLPGSTPECTLRLTPTGEPVIESIDFEELPTTTA